MIQLDIYHKLFPNLAIQNHNPLQVPMKHPNNLGLW